jgi:hypothetical protein
LAGGFDCFLEKNRARRRSPLLQHNGALPVSQNCRTFGSDPPKKNPPKRGSVAWVEMR